MQTFPPRAGIGLKPEHYSAVRASDADGLWLEVHPENYMSDGGPRLAWLEAIRADRPLSLHGVGLSLGGVEPLDRDHLAALKRLVDRFEPALVSEHFAWSTREGVYFADLFPVPTTRAAFDIVCEHIDETQTALGRTILLENPALYVELKGDMAEPDFLADVCVRTGCGLILDVNNVYVSAHNVGRDAHAYIDAVPAERVGEIHMAGHAPDEGIGPENMRGGAMLIDNHGAPIAEDVWDLYAYTLARIGPRPTLIERDTNVPPFAELLAERDRADAALLTASSTDNVGEAADV